MCAFVGSKIAGIVHGSAEHPGDIASNDALLQAAFDLGKKLAANPEE